MLPNQPPKCQNVANVNENCAKTKWFITHLHMSCHNLAEEGKLLRREKDHLIVFENWHYVGFLTMTSRGVRFYLKISCTVIVSLFPFSIPISPISNLFTLSFISIFYLLSFFNLFDCLHLSMLSVSPTIYSWR